MTACACHVPCNNNDNKKTTRTTILIIIAVISIASYFTEKSEHTAFNKINKKNGYIKTSKLIIILS